MKRCLSVLILITLALVACTPEDPVQTDPDVNQETPAPEPEPEPEPDPTPEPEPEPEPAAGSTIYGKVVAEGKGLAGVVVSDGNLVTVTDENGI